MAKSEWRVHVSKFHELSTNTYSKLIYLYRLKDSNIDDGHIYTREYFVPDGCSRFSAIYFKTEKEAQAFADKLNMENGMPVSKTEFEPEYKEMSLF